MPQMIVGPNDFFDVESNNDPDVNPWDDDDEDDGFDYEEDDE